MNDNQNRRLEAFKRINLFGNLHPEDFPAGKRVTAQLAIIRAAEASATGSSTSQSSHGGAAQSGTATKADYYDELHDDLKAISRTARSMAEDLPGGLEMRFRMPRPATYNTVLIAARAFLADATPLEAEFIANEMPADFLADLEADIAAFENAAEDQGDGQIQQVGATRSIGEAVTAGMKALRTLDPLMRNKYRNDATRLAEWLTASHVARVPRKAKEPVMPV